MIKNFRRLFILLMGVVTLTMFTPTQAYASLMIGGDSFETETEGGDGLYFTLTPAMKKLEGVKSEDKNIFKYTISHEDKKDELVFDKKNYQVKVNGKLIEDKYYEEKNEIYVPVNVFEKMNTASIVESGLMDTVIVKPAKYKYNDVAAFNLGKEKYQLPKNVYEITDSVDEQNRITYNNTGSVAVPEGKKLPLVIFLHGSYQGTGLSTYFDQGFADNMKSLAKEGFVSLGINLTPVYYIDSMDENKSTLNKTQKDLFRKILKTHVQSLLDSVNKNNDTYGFDMKDKIDFNNIILVGHSRGGQNLFLGNEVLKEMGLNTKGNISIAPAKYWKDLNNYADIPTGIIIPQQDGDVHKLDGRQIFDSMRLQKRDKDLQLIYLESANHNGFNSTIFEEDNSFVDSKGNTLKEPMPGKEQRDFASKYIVDFSKSVIEKGNVPTLSISNEGDLYGQKVLMSFVKGNSKKLFDVTSESDIKNLSGNFRKVIASNDKKKNTAKNLRLPGLTDHYPLVSLDFKNKNDKVDYKVLNNNDFTKFNTLNLEIMQDSTNPINKGSNQMLDITLFDKKGLSKTISTKPNTYSLQYRSGKMTSIALRDEEAEIMYSNHTPLSTLMIPTSEFGKEIDISNISKIEIAPSKSIGQGSFVLQSIYLSSNTDKMAESYSKFEDLTGKDRFETAGNVSLKWDKSNDIVISNGYSIIDSMTATPFAYAKNAPLLLSEKSKLHDRTKKEIKRLGAKNVYLIGGRAVLDKNIEKELSDLGIKIIRIDGANRFETSFKIAKEIDRIKDISKIAIANGYEGLADLVSISPSAAENNMPIILCDKLGNIPYSSEFLKSKNINKGYIVGGTKSIPQNINNEIKKFTNTVFERLSGKTRTETNLSVINKFYSSKSLNNLFVTKNGVVDESQLVDSLTAGVLGAREKSPIFLVGNGLEEVQKGFLNKTTLKKVTKVGGNGTEKSIKEIKDIVNNK